MSIQKESIQKITYRFEDASVPPRYHRSYTIDVTTSSVRIEVDSYGNILASETYSIEKDQFGKLRDAFETYKISNVPLKEGEGCTGGKTEKISCYDEAEIFSGWVYHCGSKDYGNLSGNVGEFAALVKSFIPDLNSLLK